MASQSLLQHELKFFLREFEPFAKKYFRKKIQDSRKYPSLISQFYKDLSDFTSGGKKLRGFLVYLGWKLGQGPVKKLSTLSNILPIALAYELLHSFLLIHDDIIDGSDTRRGKPTIHKRYENFFGQHYGCLGPRSFSGVDSEGGKKN